MYSWVLVVDLVLSVGRWLVVVLVVFWLLVGGVWVFGFCGSGLVMFVAFLGLIL